mmetsp:Transcript_106350/g.184899  ORF Transcript_106350/g.184899 Transcript_106350/m.184899 type:complete len:405 (-) Transcript_106350:101-1315(-)
MRCGVMAGERPMQQVALRRLRRIVATAAPQPLALEDGTSQVGCTSTGAEQTSSALVAAPCQGVTGSKGFTRRREAMGQRKRSPAPAQPTVVWLKLGMQGAPLASDAVSLDPSPRRGDLEIRWVGAVKDLPPDTSVLITTGTPIGTDVLDRVPKLQLVAVAFTGYDHIDLAECEARGITVVNVPGYSTNATAELVVGLVLSHLRQIPMLQRHVRQGGWHTPPHETLKLKSVGIIGTGRIGRRVAELFQAFQVDKILGYSMDRSEEFTELGGAYVKSLAALFLDADVICVCLPLTSSTRGLISRKLLELLQPDSLLVNVGRGGVIDEVALAELLEKRRFRAALDVFRREPLEKDHPLRNAPEDMLLMTPHVGYQSINSLSTRFQTTINNIRAYLAGQAMNVVLEAP